MRFSKLIHRGKLAETSVGVGLPVRSADVAKMKSIHFIFLPVLLALKSAEW